MEHREPTKGKERRKFLVEASKLVALGLVSSPCQSQGSDKELEVIAKNLADSVLEKLRKSTFGTVYRPTFQRKILETLVNDLPEPSDEDGACAYKMVVEFFKEYGKQLRDAIIEKYLTTILPKTEQQKEEERTQAVDNLLGSLENVSTQIIRTLTLLIVGIKTRTA